MRIRLANTSWRTYGRVPLVRLAIHSGTVSGIVRGPLRRGESAAAR